MSSGIVERVAELGSSCIERQDEDHVILRKNDLVLDVYDSNNLLGFKLTGSLDGTDIFIIHDTDNYTRSDSRYEYMYKDAERDAEYIARQFIGNKISKIEKMEKKFFREKQIIEVAIPNEKGQPRMYKPTTVNTTNFFE